MLNIHDSSEERFPRSSREKLPARRGIVERAVYRASQFSMAESSRIAKRDVLAKNVMARESSSAYGYSLKAKEEVIHEPVLERAETPTGAGMQVPNLLKGIYALYDAEPKITDDELATFMPTQSETIDASGPEAEIIPFPLDQTPVIEIEDVPQGLVVDEQGMPVEADIRSALDSIYREPPQAA